MKWIFFTVIGWVTLGGIQQTTGQIFGGCELAPCSPTKQCCPGFRCGVNVLGQPACNICDGAPCSGLTDDCCPGSTGYQCIRSLDGEHVCAACFPRQCTISLGVVQIGCCSGYFCFSNELNALFTNGRCDPCVPSGESCIAAQQCCNTPQNCVFPSPGADEGTCA